MSAPEQSGVHAQAILQRDRTIEELRTLVSKGLAVVDDFLPNIGSCALQDYGRLNQFCIEARAMLARGQEWEPPRCDIGDGDGRCCLRLSHPGPHVSERQVKEVKP